MKTVIDYASREIIFYKFICNDPTIINTYVGHTINFTKRKSDHKKRCQTIVYQHILLYKTIIENGGWDNWTMFEIERLIVSSKQEALQREQYWIDLQSDKLNMCKSFQLNRKEYYIENREAILKKKKKYHIENREAILKKSINWYNNNKEYASEKNKEWRENNKEYASEKHKQWRENNKLKIAADKQTYNDKNKEQINLKRREKTISKKELNLMSNEDKY